MSRKAKYSVEEKVRASERYLQGEAGAREIAGEMGMTNNGEREVRRWAAIYQANGIEGFHWQQGNQSYSAELKQKAVEEYLSGQGSVEKIAIKYKILNRCTLRNWIKAYNSNRILREYNPKPEVYATMRRKTTEEERKEIVEYCIAKGRDYKGTAEKYDVSYSQVYDWVKRYTANGEEGLKDGRGHHKSDEEVNELERLRRENLRLKKELERKDMIVELLKKVREFEGM